MAEVRIKHEETESNAMWQDQKAGWPTLAQECSCNLPAAQHIP